MFLLIVTNSSPHFSSSNCEMPSNTLFLFGVICDSVATYWKSMLFVCTAIKELCPAFVFRVQTFYQGTSQIPLFRSNSGHLLQ